MLLTAYVRSLDLNKSLTRWKHQDEAVPMSVCSEPCPAGHVQKVKGVHCCWVCIQCREYEIISDDERCVPCQNGTFPTLLPARNVCEPLPVDYMTIDSTWSVVPVVFSVFGIVLATCVLAFLKKSKSVLYSTSDSQGRVLHVLRDRGRR